MKNKKSRVGITIAGAGIDYRCTLRDEPPRTFDVGVHPERAFAILETAQKWVNGTELTYAFYEGPDRQKAAMRASFKKWKDVGIGLKFREIAVVRDAMVRIAFANTGSWSYIGRAVLTIPKAEPTMNIGWDISQNNDTGIHEIGHTLGLPHEHQNPNAGIVWDEEAVYASLGGPPNNWDRAKTYHNIIRKIPRSTVQGSNWDPNSIMHYPFEAGLIREPAMYRTGLRPRGGLSADDKTWVKTFYPAMSDSAHPVLAPFQSTELVGKSGHQSNFRIEPTTSRNYEMRTFGPSDSVMVLYERSGKELVRIAADDDSGEDKNASIKLRLHAGRQYILRVRVMYSEPGEGCSLMVW